MNCHESQQLIQRRLDGEAVPLLPAWEKHLAGCSLCRTDHAAAVRLLEGLKDLPRPRLSPQFSQKITALVLRDRTRRQEKMRLRLRVTVGLAAAVLVLVSTSYLWLPNRRSDPGTSPPVVQQSPEKKPQELTGPPLAQTWDRTRDVLASWSQRLADETAKTGQLLAAASNLEMPMPPMDLDASFDPVAAQSLLDAGQGVSQGFQVVADSARRAVTFFREIPLLDLTPPSNQ